MIKIKLSQYKNRFEILYKNELTESLSLLETLAKSSELNEKHYSLSRKLFYFSKPVMILENKKNILEGTVQRNDYKQVYLSYLTLNNLFNQPPAQSLLDLKTTKQYMFNIDIITEDDIKIIPYLIHYKNTKKSKLTRIKEKNQVVDFNQSDQCRLTFKIMGHGNFQIKNISIKSKG